MKKIIFSTLIIVLSGLVFSACIKTANQAATTEKEAPVVEKQQTEGGFSGSIKDLMSFNKNQKCTWTAPDQGTGTVYISGKKTRSEFSMLAMNGQPAQDMFSISDEEWAYSWNPATKKGMKVKVEDTDGEAADINDYKSEGEDEVDYQASIEQDYEFKCEGWRADAKMFVPPTDVEFTDMDAMVEQMEQGTQNMKQFCEMLTGEDKVECLRGFEE